MISFQFTDILINLFFAIIMVYSKENSNMLSNTEKVYVKQQLKLIDDNYHLYEEINPEELFEELEKDRASGKLNKIIGLLTNLPFIL
jgi:hypothetical protein